jgi:hypothetical protein
MKPAVGHLHADCRQPEFSGHRSASSGDQQLLANQLRTVFQDHHDPTVTVATGSRGARTQSYVNSLISKDVGHLRGDFGIFARQQ